MIYFIQCDKNGPIKIGHSTQPRYRLSQLQNDSPYDLRLLGVMAGDLKQEAELHSRFSEYRLRNEWFKPSLELLEFIQTYSRELPPVKREYTDPDKISLEEQARRWRRGSLDRTQIPNGGK